MIRTTRSLTRLSRVAMKSVSCKAGLTRTTKLRAFGMQMRRLRAAPTTSTALAFAAVVISQLSKDHPVALNVIGRALSLNPSSAMAHFMGAQIHALAGDAPGAITHANRALRLSPFDPTAYLAYTSLGAAAIHEARYVEGAEFYARAAQSVLGDVPFYISQAVALALRDGWRKRDTLPDEGWTPPGLSDPNFLKVRNGADARGQICRGAASWACRNSRAVREARAPRQRSAWPG